MIAWLLNNKEWIFSGIGVFILSGIIALIFRRGSSGNNTVTQIPSIMQTPAVTQAPVLNINVSPHEASSTPVSTSSPSNKSPLFALNPLVVTRNVSFVSGRQEDKTAQVCIARFKITDGLSSPIQSRFEASIDYVERLSASGMPYQSRAAHINQGQWLRPVNDVQELILAIEGDSTLFAPRAVDKSESPGQQNLVELELTGSRPFATVALTDLANGRTFHMEYELAYDRDTRTLQVRQTRGLH